MITPLAIFALGVSVPVAFLAAVTGYRALARRARGNAVGRLRRDPSPAGEQGTGSPEPAAFRADTPTSHGLRSRESAGTPRKWTAQGLGAASSDPAPARAEVATPSPSARELIEAGTSPAGPGDPRGLGPAFQLGGRAFRVVHATTIAQDAQLMRYVRAAGLDDVTMGADETAEEFGRRLLNDLVRTADTLELLGCLVLPDGLAPEEWTPAIAHSTARHIAGLSDETSKTAVRGLLTSFLAGFFELGLTSFWRSAKSPESAAASPAPAQPASPTTTATGTASSSSSPELITTPLGG